MAYARWSYSNWYVYWSCESGETIDEQRLVIIHTLSNDSNIVFSFCNLEEIAECSKKEAIKHLRKLLGLNLSDSEYEELLVYVKEWIEDVKESFKGGK